MDTLTPRLKAIASLVPHGANVADIGTDHGYVPIWLVKNGVSPAVTATDIESKPLAKAVENAKAHGVEERLRFILADGLSGIAEGSADTVIIAGMGGETIAGILERAPWTCGALLILQPMTKLPLLRGWLLEHGYVITREVRVKDAGKIYPILTVEGRGVPSKCEPSPREEELLRRTDGCAHWGQALPAYSPAELMIGRVPAFERDELFYEYLTLLTAKTRRAVDGLERSNQDAAAVAKLRFMREAFEGLIEMKEK